tara:strand:- start:4645 stop:5505 length:861 start_codon:yes stop_codon:yes gene_type:complete
MINKVVIPAAGMGTRLLTITKEIPKEMLPLHNRNSNGVICLKPVVQLVYEQLFNAGFKEFCFIVGRGKRTIEDHFSPDQRYLARLEESGRSQESRDLEEFYKKIDKSTIIWINQPTPKGFGHAIQQAKSFTNQEPFLVHAGDTYISSNNEEHINQIVQMKEKTDTTLCLLEVEETKHYGIAEIEGVKQPYQVKKVEEKPEKPSTNLAIMPIYLFTEKIYKALEETQPGKGNEIQLTDGIQKQIELGQKIMAVKLKKALHLDIGTPESYWQALRISYERLANNRLNS